MKKLFPLFLIIFGFSNFSIADHRVNLSCAIYEVFSVTSFITREVYPPNEALIIFPHSQKFLFKSVYGYYQSKGNKIIFDWTTTSGSYRRDYSLDKTTGVLKYDFYGKKENGEYEEIGRFTGKCEKKENLF